MVPTIEVAEPAVRELSEAESVAFFEGKARQLLGISGEEFLRRWDAGDYDGIADHPSNGDIIYLALLGASDT